MDDILKKIDLDVNKIEIPEKTIRQWQQLLDMLVELSGVRDAVIRRYDKASLESESNKEEQDKSKFYLNYPILWPGGERYGRITIYDNEEINSNHKLKLQLDFVRNLIENNLKLIYQNKLNYNLSNYYSKLIDTLPIGVMIEDMDGRILKVNEIMKDITGFSKKELLASNIFETVVPDDQRDLARENIKKIKNDQVLIHELPSTNGNGEKSYIRLNERKITLPNNKEGIVSIQSDITEKKKAQKKVKELLKKQQVLLDNIDIQIWFAEDIDKYGFANKAHAEFMGLDKEEIKGKKISQVMRSKKESDICLDGNKKVFEEKKRFNSIERIESAGGELRDLSITKIPVFNENDEVEYAVCTAVDVTEKRKSEEKIKYASYHDSLTDLYNRSYLEKKIQDLNSARKLPIALIMADLNGLKLVNDTYGHHEGDKLLKNMADILKQSCRGDDIIARWGGDEFVILLPESDKKAAKNVVKRINKKIADSYLEFEDGSRLPLSAALGYGVKKHYFEDIFDILVEAENKMYKNKLTESRSIKSNILNTLLQTLSEKSQETSSHSNRMELLAKKLGEEIALSESELNKLTLAAKLHDIGKTVIPEKILNKSGELTESEWKEIEKHPAVGHRILNATEEFSHISDEVLSHHENWDGSGYPRGLKGEEIPLLSRIIAIVDAYDVMTTEQVYKAAISKEEALKEIGDNAGGQFDPQLAKKFIELMH